MTGLLACLDMALAFAGVGALLTSAVFRAGGLGVRVAGAGQLVDAAAETGVRADYPALWQRRQRP